jgi:HSP20 family protein
MAKQNGKTNEEQTQGTQGSSAGQGTRSSSGGLLVNRGGSNPLALTVSPFEIFLSNPFTLMRRMTEEMDRAFSEFNGSNGDSNLWAPAIEVSQRDGQYSVHADLPGLKPEDVKVEVRDGALIIEGERKFEREESRGRMHRTELRYGTFARVIPLPEEAKAENAQAKFENGVLEVTVPIAEQQSNRHQIPVQSAQSSSMPAGSAGLVQGSEKAA